MDFFASERQYVDHLLPIWLALEPAERGTWFCSGMVRAQLEAAGVKPVTALPRAAGSGPVVVAAISDYTRTGSRPVVFVEHGAGQRYDGDLPRRHGGYSGGTGRDRTVLFVCNSPAVARANAATYPDAAVAVVGCPRLDAWAGRPDPSDGCTVAFSWHWDCPVAPESRWALPHYQRALPGLVAELRAAGWHVLGHGHPKAWGRLEAMWRQLGVEPVRDWAQVAQRATVYVADNSSTLYEWAALDRPVVLLNAPWYRRNVEHGLRFWSHAGIGPQADEPADVLAAIARARRDDADQAAMRRRLVADIYPHTDGHAAERAATAIRQHVLGRTWEVPRMPDPFRGTRVVRTGTVAPRFPTERLRALGATDAELDEAVGFYQEMGYGQQIEAARLLAQQSDDELRLAIEGTRLDKALAELDDWAAGEALAGRYLSKEAAIDALWDAAEAGLLVAEQQPPLEPLVGVPQPAEPADGSGSDSGGEPAGGDGNDLPAGTADGYPNGGTISEVLGWVSANGTDTARHRAAYALDQERAGQARRTLLAPLEKIAAG